jgi:hypothetical protein
MVYETKLNVHIAQQEVNFIKYVTVWVEHSLTKKLKKCFFYSSSMLVGWISCRKWNPNTFSCRWIKYFVPVVGSPAPGGLASTETYDFAKDVWTKIGNLPTLRSDGRSLTIRNRHLWFGSRSGALNVAATSEILEFSLQSGWVPLQMILVSPATVPIVIPYNLWSIWNYLFYISS